MSYIDLHLHSTYSDGTLTPLQLVQEAKAIGLKAISLTDHDTTEGVEKIITHGAAYGIETLTGVELSAHFDNLSIHILGYGLRHKDPLSGQDGKQLAAAGHVRFEPTGLQGGTGRVEPDSYRGRRCADPRLVRPDAPVGRQGPRVADRFDGSRPHPLGCRRVADAPRPRLVRQRRRPAD